MILPAIDLMDGKVVRLKQGDFKQRTDYPTNPLSIARNFISQGAERLHVIDLDGAKAGSLRNDSTLASLISAGIKFQLGGGIRNAGAADSLLSSGVRKIILGTAASPGLISSLSRKWGPARIGVAIDVKDGKAMGEGWVSELGEPLGLAKAAESSRAGFLVVTAVEKDGMMQGPDLELIRSISSSISIPIIASGGISSLADIHKVKFAGASGAIIGKALYEGKINLKEAISCWQSA